MGLEIGLLTQEGSQERGTARSNQGRKAGPTAAATRGPKDELMVQRKSSLCPTGRKPLCRDVGFLREQCTSISQPAVTICSVCMELHMHTCVCVYIHTQCVVLQ